MGGMEMAILVNEAKRVFHLRSDHMSWVMGVGTDEMLHHIYWGDRLDAVPDLLYDRAPYRRRNRVENKLADSPECTREYFHYECPVYGTSDFRMPAIQGRDMLSGSSILDLRYRGCEVISGSPSPSGLPGVRAGDAETLVITLLDPVSRIRVQLYYILIAEQDVLVRWTAVENDGTAPFMLSEVMSGTIDFEDGTFSLLTLNGTTLREFTPDVREIHPGITQIGSTRGSSSHQHSPNAVLMRPGTDNYQGSCYSLSLIYGGNYVLRFERDPYGSLRAQGGIHPLDFSWKLDPGDQFESPELLMAFSGEGLNGLSGQLHDCFRKHILRGPWAGRIRPLLLNTWEACYFKINEESLLKIGEVCSEKGIELLVLDDGWFGHRDAANSSLGDWYCNENKFPHGIKYAAEELAKHHVKLGIWLEMEMVSPDSELYRQHSDWCLHAPQRVRTEWRNQLVLDLSREEVVNYLIDSVDRLLAGSGISYIKWDMNRRLTEVYSSSLPSERQGEVRHRYMLGLYRLLSHITEHYPDILMENCASGGGRYDYGMYCFFHQGWLSDNTDPVCRLSMQNAASVFYPPEVITGHVAVSPNHQIGRSTPFAFRKNVCMLFNAGFELDPTKLSEEEQADLQKTCSELKKVRNITHGGRFIRLSRDVCPRDEYGWMCVTEDRAVAAYYRPYCAPESAYWRIGLPGLEPGALYCDRTSGLTMSGRDWLHIGWRPNWEEGDFFSEILILERIDPNVSNG